MRVTNSPHSQKEPYKTDKTDIQSNHDFMTAIFSTPEGDKLPLWLSLIGNPNNVPSKKWFAKPWRFKASDLNHKTNTYFSLASFSPCETGEYRRFKEQFASLHAVMMDDLGTKVPMDRMTLEPSWLIETSAGNHQAGYILSDPITDPKLADQFVNAIIDAGLCDAGANGPTTRMARLPFGINGKTEPAFKCQLKLWNPHLRYSVDEMVHALELDMSQKNRKSKSHKTTKGEPCEEIFVDCPSENPIIQALKSKGLYKSPLGDAKHDITCPWVHEHTNQVDGGTAYFEPEDTYPIGGFKCMHGHCSNRHIRELLEFLGIEITQARMKAKIRYIAGEIHRISDRAEQELTKQGRFYQRGGLIVTVANDASTKDIFVKEISRPALLSALSGAALWEKYDKRSQGWIRIDPPDKAVSVLYDATNYRHLAPLNGLVHQPYLRADGSLATNAGYDTASGMFGVFDARKFDIPLSPTLQDAQKALEKISSLLTEFSFATDTDRAGALSAILTAAIRPSLSVAPMFHVRAPQISSGKSFLCQLITAFASPRKGSPTSFPHDDEECRKLLLAELLRAPAVIEFDNLTSDLIAHKSLCTALTSDFLTGRILGVSKTATVSTRTLFLSSGNNVGPVQDMTRRCLTINLDPRCETPASRSFVNPNLLSDLHKARAVYVSAALTIIRAWINAGSPVAECKSIATYEEWSNLCRQPLLWLGFPDPVVSIFEAMNDDPDREQLGRLLFGWKSEFGHTPRMIRDAVKRANETSSSELLEILNDIAGDKGEINRKMLGRWIKRHANRIVNGLRFVRDQGNRSAEAWRVESVL